MSAPENGIPALLEEIQRIISDNKRFLQSLKNDDNGVELTGIDEEESQQHSPEDSAEEQ